MSDIVRRLERLEREAARIVPPREGIDLEALTTDELEERLELLRALGCDTGDLPAAVADYFRTKDIAFATNDELRGLLSEDQLVERIERRRKAMQEAQGNNAGQPPPSID